MRKKSRMGCLTLAAMLCISNVSISAAEVNQELAEVYVSTAKGASVTDVVDGVKLDVSSGKDECVVTDYDGSSTEIDLTSATFNNYTITGIGTAAFSGKKNLTKVILPNTIKTIGRDAFSGCTSLATCNLPETVENIGAGAFYNTALTEITIPASCKAIAGELNQNGVFGSCDSLVKVNFGERTDNQPISIGEDAFYKCTNLKTINIPETCTGIGKNAFYECTSLATINIPKTCTDIGKGAFYKTNLSAVIIPIACTSIGEQAFYGCEALRSVTFEAPSSPDDPAPQELSIGTDAFYGCKTLSSIALPARVTSIPNKAFYNCTALSSVQISEGCTSIGNSAFYQCAIKEITIPKSCNLINANAFYNVDNLSKITFLNKDTVITANAFAYGNEKMTILAETGGNVEEFAKENGYSYQQPVKSLTITKNPNKVLYYYGESLLLDGMTISAEPVEGTGTALIAVNYNDCTISGFDSSRVGKQTIKVAYGGAEASFDVTVAYNMEKATASAPNLVYTGEALTNTFIVKGYETKTTLVEGQDYKVEYVGEQVNAGEKSAKIIGIGNYSGERTVTYRVNPKNLDDIDLTTTIDNVPYTGSECKPEVTLKSGTKVIDPSNYTVEYSSNVNAGTATVKISGKNNYTGVEYVNFKILPKSIKNATYTLDQDVYEYHGSPVSPVATVILDGQTLIDSRDYYVEYQNNNVAGKATALITGKGNYTDILEIKFEIVQKSIETAEVTFDDTQNVYDGSEKKPLPKVVVDGKLLEKNVDYTVDYRNNINAGTATVVITGKALYKGEVEKTFIIAQKPIQAATAKVAELEYTGEILTNAFVVKADETGKALLEGSDYRVEYVGDQLSAGEKTAKVIGTGNYSGEIEVKYRITPKNFQSMNITISVNDMEYNGEECKPEVTLMNGETVMDPINYVVAYSSNTTAGTATVTITGSNNYTGVLQKNFKILPKSLSTAKVALDKSAYTYSGEANCPTPTVTVDGKTLAVHTDYDVTYVNNKTVGTAKVVITGKNNYNGTVEAKFDVTAKSIETAVISLDKTVYAYNGDGVFPVTTVTMDGKMLQKGVDYDISFKNNVAVGTATVDITGKGFYTGTISKTFQIDIEVGTITTIESNNYQITGVDTVMFKGVSGAVTTVSIPDTVSFGGKTFKVTAIADKALSGSKAKSVTIGQNVTQIGKQAFMKASKLKKITIKATGLKSVGKKAFKGIYKKATIKVPKKKFAAYKKLLKGKGQSAGVKIKK